MNSLRPVLIIGIAALLGALVLVTAIFQMPPARRPLEVGRLWPTHPVALTERGMTELGMAAGDNRPLSSETLKRIAQLARSAPLAVEPLLIHGALAQIDGRQAQAEALFSEARRRDPRSAAARYFLANRYLETGRVVEGLHQVAVLSRLVPGASTSFIPAVAAFAQTKGAVPQLRAFFIQSPELEPDVLVALAADARNADLILALASKPRSAAPNTAWRSTIVAKLVEAGAFAKAYAVWQRLANVDAAPGLFNPRFLPLDAPPPFNWTLATQGGGIAEPTAGGLRVVHYGRETVVLASQLMVLPSGAYRLGFRLGGEPNDGMRWTVKCIPAGSDILALPLPSVGNRMVAGRFVVPASGCAAQRIDLSAAISDEPKTVEMTISELALSRVGQR